MSEALKNQDFRIDAEFHRRLPPDNLLYQYVPIGQVLTTAQYGMSIEMNEEGEGFPIYRMNEISHMLCNQEVNKCANVSSAEAEPFLLKERDVLFNRTNSQVFVGRTGIYKPFSQEPRVFASYLIRLCTDENLVLPEYLTAFLNSYFGVLDIKRRARISINQSNVNAEEVKAIRIPILSKEFQIKIQKCFEQAHLKFIESKGFYITAENILLSEYGLLNQNLPDPNIYEQQASSILNIGRLDAEYFSPRVQSLLKLLGCQNLNVGDVALVRKEFFDPLRTNKFQYIEIGDVTKSGEVNSSVLDSDDAPSRATWYVRAGDIITSTVRPIRCLSAIIRPEQDGYVCSSGFAVLQPQAIPSELLLVYLRLSVICELMDLHTTASMYPAISVPDILNIPFLKPSEETTKQVVKAVKNSHKLRREAEGLLEGAKRAVEIAIEESEAVSINFLNNL